MSGPAVAVGVVADRVFGEPPGIVHPVARFGQSMARIEQRMYRDDRAVGVMFCMIGVGSAAACGVVLQRCVGRSAALAISIAVATAGRMLGREANAIGALLVDGDLEAARTRLPSLVGRSPDGLDAMEIARAVIESVAENSVDAVIAPMVWGLIGGAPAVLAHRAVNTLDAMVGHHSPRYERFGWASARLDDIANWLPARLGAVCVATVSPAHARSIRHVIRRDSGQHPSPNGGVIEAAYAAALGIRLGGSNRYGEVVVHRGVLGDGEPATADDVGRAVRLLDLTTVALAAIGVAGSLGRLRRRG